MNNIDKRILEVDKDIRRLEDRAVKEVGGLFRDDFRYLKRELEKLYDKYEEEGQINMLDYVVEGESEFQWKVAGRLINSYEEVIDKTEDILVNTAKKTRDNIVTMDKIPAITKEFDVAKVVNSDMKGIRWAEVHGKNRDKVIKEIAKEVKFGLEKGQTFHQVSDTLAKSLGQEMYVVERVVRTESHRVSNLTRLESYRELAEEGMPILKKWISSRDERVRHQHDELDGQAIGIDEEFEVEGYSAQAPGQFGVPHLDINCRCSLSMDIDL